MQRLAETTAWLRDRLVSDRAAACGAAYPYLRLFALSIIGGIWAGIMQSIRNEQGAFYDTKRKLAHFYMLQVLPETESLAKSIVDGAEALAGFGVADFDS